MRGIALAVESGTEYIAITPSLSSEPGVRIIQVTENDVHILGVRGPELTAEDVLSATLNGMSVTFWANGSEVVSAQLEEVPRWTRHGLFAFYQSVAEWDHSQFTP